LQEAAKLPGDEVGRNFFFQRSTDRTARTTTVMRDFEGHRNVRQRAVLANFRSASDGGRGPLFLLASVMS